MASAAMRQPLDQIGAAIPFRTLRVVRSIRPAAKKQQFPAGDHKSLIERKGKLIFACGRVNRFPCHQAGIERVVILVGNVREVVVGECGIEVLPVAIDA